MLPKWLKTMPRDGRLLQFRSGRIAIAIPDIDLDTGEGTVRVYGREDWIAECPATWAFDGDGDLRATDYAGREIGPAIPFRWITEASNA